MTESLGQRAPSESAYDEDGFVLDEYGNAFGWCNSCGEEAPADSECCSDGEVVPFDEPSAKGGSHA